MNITIVGDSGQCCASSGRPGYSRNDFRVERSFPERSHSAPCCANSGWFDVRGHELHEIPFPNLHDDGGDAHGGCRDGGDCGDDYLPAPLQQRGFRQVSQSEWREFSSFVLFDFLLIRTLSELLPCYTNKHATHFDGDVIYCRVESYRKTQANRKTHRMLSN